jgi:1-acyl-sn-glycerol-3-phosphate acyltransferase
VTDGRENKSLKQRSPRVLRMALMGALFALFFFGSPIIALVLFPLLRLTSRSLDVYRTRCTYLLHRGMRLIAATARFVGIVDYDDAELPASLDRSKPYVMICNHPTFIDMLVVLARFRDLTCVTSGRWSKHWALGRLLRSTNYLPGPGSGLPESEDMLATMVAHLGKGHPLLVFPEGQRSMPDQLRRFRRGAIEAAARANVPIVPLFLAIDRPYLTKNVPLWRPPAVAPKYSFEWFDTIDPAAFDHDGKRIAAHVDALYEKRFDEQVARWRSINQETRALAA